MKKILFLTLSLMLVFSSVALANKTSVAIVAPASVAAGTEVTITINVSHKGNSGFHHTNWVVVKADGAEIARWDFKASSLPESADFTRVTKFTVTKPVEIIAQGHCSIHGSKGPVAFKIAVQ
ncbi:MAG: desulfoferrodoxin family protein [Acidobacteriota bacterium]|nr:desulfoferrodoxin family protein [Acidobacteriota bacterium]